MKTYFDAYRERMERNNATFLKIAEELQQKGYKVFAPKDRLINFLKIIKDGKHVVFGFSDVPYRWYLQICLKPSKEHGSGRTVKEIATDGKTHLPSLILSGQWYRIQM